MQGMGMESVTVEGTRLRFDSSCMPASQMTRRDEAFAWLRSIGEGDIIKHDVTVSFNTGQDNMAGSVVEDANMWSGPRAKT